MRLASLIATVNKRAIIFNSLCLSSHSPTPGREANKLARYIAVTRAIQHHCETYNKKKQQDNTVQTAKSVMIDLQKLIAKLFIFDTIGLKITNYVEQL